MRSLIGPTLRLALAILSVTVSTVLLAYSLGLIPDEDRAALEARAKTSEALAIQIAIAATKGDEALINDTIALVATRNRDIRSIALRRADGELFVQAGNHSLHWVEPTSGRSTPNHVQIPLTNANAGWGKLEIAFHPLFSGEPILGLSSKVTILLGFLIGAGFVGYFFVLKRAFRELDPSQVVPERVQSAFDTLTEGVLILDERGRVVLSNRVFAEIVGISPKAMFAKPVDDLPWLQFDKSVGRDALPWQIAMRERKAVTGILMSMKTSTGSVRRFSVSTTPILDSAKAVRGVITSFYDFTELHNKNEQLKYSIDQLRETHAQVEEQNKKLSFLASSDPLTGCLNRRTFFAEFERKFHLGHGQKESVIFLLLDLDFFKRINDRFGHIVGDEVLIKFAQTIKALSRGQDLVGRYGGEEFCVALISPSDRDAKQFAERLCRRVEATSTSWLPSGEPVTVSVGVASVGAEPCGAMDLVARADKALYAAKAAGRNRVVRWEELPEEVQGDRAAPQPQHTQAA